MATPDDNMRQEGGPPDGRPRRQPPTIDVKAVEVSLDGSGATAAATGPAGGPADTTRSPKRILASLWSTRLAVIGSAGLGAAIVAGALWIYFTPGGADGPQRDAAAREAARPDEVIEGLAKLETEMKAIQARAPQDEALASRIAALEATLTPLVGRVAEAERGVRDNAAVARNAGERADAAAGLFDELKKSRGEQDSSQLPDRTAIESFADRLRMLEALAAALEQKQQELQKQAELDRAAKAQPAAAPDRAVRGAVIVLALRDAIERDDPFAVELAAARSLGFGQAILAALEPFAATGVPTRNALLRDLSALLPELQRLSAPAVRDGSYFDRLQASATRMMNIRPAQDAPGDDPATVIGRIEFKMARQDMTGVVAELDKLPAPAKELSRPWRAKALARQGAIEAARQIATASLAKLGEPVAREPTPQ